LVIGLGPGFTAGEDVDVVIETERGHNLGRVLYQGQAAPDTAIPGEVGGESKRILFYGFR
jgi:xanthine dehydrogenase accessory factor